MSKLIKRTKAEKEEHFNQISRMYIKGMTQMEMAKRLGLSQGQISNDLKALLNQWREARIDTIDFQKNRELERINLIEEEMWQAWELSKTRNKKIISTSKSGEVHYHEDTLGRKFKEEPEKYWNASVREEEAIAGDMTYMNGIMWCVQERCKIASLYAPKKVAQTDPTGEHEAQSAKEILNDIISGILKRAPDEDKNVVEGELLELDADNDIILNSDDTPELAQRIRQERIKRLPPHPDDVQFDQEGNILVEAKNE